MIVPLNEQRDYLLLQLHQLFVPLLHLHAYQMTFPACVPGYLIVEPHERCKSGTNGPLSLDRGGGVNKNGSDGGWQLVRKKGDSFQLQWEGRDTKSKLFILYFLGNPEQAKPFCFVQPTGEKFVVTVAAVVMVMVAVRTISR